MKNGTPYSLVLAVAFIVILIWGSFASCTNHSKHNKLELEGKAKKAYQKKRYSEASYYYTNLIMMDSTNGEYYFGRAGAYLWMRKTDLGVEDLLKASRLNYMIDVCYYNIGIAYSFTHDSTAIIYFGKALELMPGDSDYQSFYTQCLTRLKTDSANEAARH